MGSDLVISATRPRHAHEFRLLAGSFFGTDSFVPLTLNTVHGYSPAAGGLPLVIGALGWTAGSWYQSRRTAPARHTLIRAGCALVAAAAAGMVAVAWPGVPGWVATPLWAVAGAGMGLGMASVSVLTLNLSPPAERGANGAALQICDVLASATLIGLGGVVLATVTARRKRDPLSQEALALAHWTIVVTNLPPHRLSFDQAFMLLRLRWQIELLFKLWKQHAHLETSRSQQPNRIMCELYAKLLGLVIQHALLLATCWDVPNSTPV